MKSDDPDAFVTPWAPEPELIIDLNAAAEEDDTLEPVTEDEIEVMREDVRALRAALDNS